MQFDQQGNSLTGATSHAVANFDQAVHTFNIYRGDPVGLLDRAIAEAPAFAMAHILKAVLFAVATEPAATEAAKQISAHVKTLPMNERERSLVAALDHILAGNWTVGATALDRHSMRYPLDLVALQAGHVSDFFRANARDLRDRIARVLPRWSADTPGYAVVLGMYSFGLEECGAYAKAEDVGRQAVELQPLDCWAHHAVAHVMEMQGRAAEGVQWMQDREPAWSGDDNFLKGHNWWHKAVFHMDLGQSDEALALYDGPIRSGRSPVVLDMIDASALLWRLELDGRDVGDRWIELAAAWDAHADGKLYPFNDWHAAMAYLGAGRIDDVYRLLAQYNMDSASTAEAAAWARTTGKDLIEGFAAFHRGDHEAAAEQLYTARHIVNTFGGSHAQRDIIDWTLTEAALRGGMSDLAEAMANERLAHKPTSPLNRRLFDRATNLPIAAQ